MCLVSVTNFNSSILQIHLYQVSNAVSENCLFIYLFILIVQFVKKKEKLLVLLFIYKSLKVLYIVVFHVASNVNGANMLIPELKAQNLITKKTRTAKTLLTVFINQY